MQENPEKKHITPDEALKKLRRYCAYQDRCHQEVRHKLINLGVYGHELEEIMASLVGDNFLNEERFARSFARGKFKVKHWGRNKILLELQKRDISEYCIKKAMEEIAEEEYRAILGETLQKKELQLKESDPLKKRNKLAQHAIRRGFEPELVWSILEP